MKYLGFFVTYGGSFSKWDKTKLLSREVKPYQELAKYFEKIYMFSYGGKDDKEYQSLFPANVEIITRPRFIPVSLYSIILPFVHFKLVKKLTIVKSNQMVGSWAAVTASNLSSAKLVIRCGYEWLQYLENVKASSLRRLFSWVVECYAYKNADAIIITSNEGASFISKKFSVQEDKIRVIPNYVDTKLFYPMEVRKEENRVIFVGRLDPVKNLDGLIKALKGLGVTLEIIGGGNLMTNLSRLAEENGVKVNFGGVLPQSALPEYLSRSSIFVLPSFSEGNPKVLLEAMSCGVASIASDIPANREVFVGGRGGILCKTDVESISESIKKLLDDSILRKNLGIEARDIIMKHFSFETLIKKEIELYEEIV
jgi:glycosyltransferase involved in cell wall biosynthesis